MVFSTVPFLLPNRYNRCHYRYSASVLAFVAIPGFLTGWYYLKMIVEFLGCTAEKGSCCHWFLYLCGTLIGPILFIPCTFVYLTYAIFKVSNEDLSEKSYRERKFGDIESERTERYAKG